MFWHMLLSVIALVMGEKVLSISSPSQLTREVGQDVVFMINSTAMSEATWGVRDGDTNYLNPRLYRVLSSFGEFPDTKINSTSYAGRVSFVGNLSKGHAWFKISNLNISDTNQYMALIMLQGEKSYRYIATKLDVIQPVPTTATITVPTASSSPTGIITQGQTAFPSTEPPILKNLTTSLKVKREFSKSMEDSNSLSFRNFAKEFQTAIEQAYKNDSNFHYFGSVRVISLREGSINVTFIVFFTSGIKRDSACAPLENAIKDGNLGNFEIVPGSLGCSDPKTSTPRPPASTTGVHPGIIAGVVIVGVLAIAGLVIAILFVCRKKSSKKAYRSSTGPAPGYEMDARHGEPEEQYASVQKPGASVPKQSGDQSLPQYAVVDKSKKNKNKPRESDELVYAVLDHDHNASMSSRPPSDRRSTGATGDTVYADIQSEKKKQRYPPPQYGNIQDNSYA
ncbi:uncharacterized protein LOC116304196 [Actinia tenebrosa]|uniref:Uncharacterized protein LOC116304196 n=1 Tax=Actinia tenebrosa TaxID=6105 RepID=A0A6P8IS77_ACTTE|nr:uncharacterized protein LOC116304196 [Actinia tenebrosa]